MPKVWPGKPFPLGARYDGDGTNFSLFSENAERVELCLFDEGGDDLEVRVDVRSGPRSLALLSARSRARPALRLSRARSVRPATGSSLQPGEAAARSVRQGDRRHRCRGRRASLRVRTRRSEDADLEIDDDDDARGDAEVRSSSTSASTGRTIDRSNTPWQRPVIYETHVKGFTKLHPDVREELRGTYAGLGVTAVIEYLHDARRHRGRAAARAPLRRRAGTSWSGLSNYWGYNSIGYFAPHARYSATGMGGEQVREFKAW